MCYFVFYTTYHGINSSWTKVDDVFDNPDDARKILSKLIYNGTAVKGYVVENHEYLTDNNTVAARKQKPYGIETIW